MKHIIIKPEKTLNTLFWGVRLCVFFILLLTSLINVAQRVTTIDFTGPSQSSQVNGVTKGYGSHLVTLALTSGKAARAGNCIFLQANINRNNSGALHVHYGSPFQGARIERIDIYCDIPNGNVHLKLEAGSGRHLFSKTYQGRSLISINTSELTGFNYLVGSVDNKLHIRPIVPYLNSGAFKIYKNEMFLRIYRIDIYWGG